MKDDKSWLDNLPESVGPGSMSYVHFFGVSHWTES